MKYLLILAVAVLLFNTNTNAQGCVAIRSTGAVCTKQEPGKVAKGWQLNTSYRYFKSFRHFVGKEEQKERLENNTEVINWQHTLNLTLLRQFNIRWSVGIDVPLVFNTRSSLYEHGGNNAGPSARHSTKASGLSDIRVTAYRWLLDPKKSMKGNIQAGLGVKFPTGKYNVEDVFHKGGEVGDVTGPVDQSIQPGDGGLGVTAEINAFYGITHHIGLYGNFYYLVNPRVENGVSTARGGTPSQAAIDYKSATMSVPDQYMARAGGNFTFGDFLASAGMRFECIPSSDLIGGDEGFRRPGYVLSVEPGVSYKFKKFVAFATVPVAVQRNRTQSNSDKLRTAATGVYAHGDAAFADYSLNIGASFKL
ncbi:MAG: hypothetical protein J7497_12090 [Chitinophagaceae bacterium]|nr:hypothetical protein [Chitinophagaceae bacterium]